MARIECECVDFVVLCVRKRDKELFYNTKAGALGVCEAEKEKKTCRKPIRM